MMFVRIVVVLALLTAPSFPEPPGDIDLSIPIVLNRTMVVDLEMEIDGSIQISAGEFEWNDAFAGPGICPAIVARLVWIDATEAEPCGI